MARKKTSKKATNSVEVDFTGVEAGGAHPEGDFLATVEGIEQKEGSTSGEPYLNWKFKTEKGTAFYSTSLQPQSLFNLRNLLENLGLEVPDGPMELDFDEIIGTEVVISVKHEKYEGKNRARVVDFAPAEEAEEEADEEEDEEEDEETETDTEDEVETVSADEVREMDEDELKDLLKKYELKVNLKALKTIKKKQAAVIAALEEGGFLEDDEDE